MSLKQETSFLCQAHRGRFPMLRNKEEHLMRGLPMSIGKILALVAAVIFVLAAVGAWPDSLAEDLEPVALGLAFLAASFVVP